MAHKPHELDEEPDELNPESQRRAAQDLRRQIMRRLDSVTDLFLLQSVLEMLDDAEADLMDGEKDPELVEASEIDLDHPDNRKRPAPIHQKYKNDADSWLEGLGR